MKNATKNYAAGVLTGIILGVSAVLIIQSGQGKTDSLKLTERKVVTQEQNTPAEKQKPQAKPARTSEKTVMKLDSNSIDSLKNMTDSLAIDSLAIATDSLQLSTDTSSAGEDIVVMEDRLIATTRLPVYDMTEVRPDNKRKKNIDSLLIDDNYTSTEDPESLSVEFWESPINYKGYRRIHTRLVIFGLTAADSIRIFKREDQLYMNIKNKDFPINESDEFRSIWFDN